MESPLRARCLLPGRRTTSGISRTRQLPRTWNALPGGAGQPSGVPRAGEAELCERSAGTHLPGRHRARVPGGRSAGMARAPPVRRAAELELPARPRRRLGHFRARRRGGASVEGRGQPGEGRALPASAACRSPGDVLFTACCGGPEPAEWQALDVAPTLSLLESSAPGWTFLGPEKALGRQRWRPLPAAHSHAWAPVKTGSKKETRRGRAAVGGPAAGQGWLEGQELLDGGHPPSTSTRHARQGRGAVRAGSSPPPPPPLLQIQTAPVK